MSRTYKDAPYKVRKDRLSTIGDPEKSCVLCAEGNERVISTGFTAIFFAHEARELERFLATAEEEGYSVSIREAQGYLGDTPYEPRALSPLRRRESPFAKLFNPERALYSAPHGIADHLLWTSEGDAAKSGARKRMQLIDFDPIFGSLSESVSTKKNIFKVISVSRERTVKRYRYHYHDDGLSYLLSVESRYMPLLQSMITTDTLVSLFEIA